MVGGYLGDAQRLVRDGHGGSAQVVSLERMRGQMTPVSPVMPGSESIEIVLGKGQPEYVELPAVYLDPPSRPMITRWRLTDEERGAISIGADIVLQQLTFQQKFQPVNLQVVYSDESPVLVE